MEEGCNWMAESRKRKKCLCLDLGERDWQTEGSLCLLKTQPRRSLACSSYDISLYRRRTGEW